MTEQHDTQEQTSTLIPAPAAWKKVVVWSARVCLLLLVLITILLTGGRLMTPMIATQKSTIEAQLSALLGTQVNVGEVKGKWFRFGPVLDVTGLEIITSDNNAGTPHLISSISIKPAMAETLFARSLVIDQIIVQSPVFVFRQNENGGWSLDGLTAGSVDYTQAIIDFLLSTHRIQIVEADLSLLWADGHDLQLDNVYIDLSYTQGDSNAEAQHLVQVQARIDGQQSPFQLQVNISGDPREQFTGSAYLHTTELELADYIKAAQVDFDSATLSGDFWLSAEKNEQGFFYALQSNLDSLALQGAGSGESLINTVALDVSEMGLTLQHDEVNRWQVWLGEAELDWLNRPWRTGQIYLEYQDQDDSRPLAFSAASVDLAMLSDVIDDLVDLPTSAASALSDLDPKGELVDVVITTNLDPQSDGNFLLQGNLKDVEVGAWQGAPAGRGIQGYVQADKNHGFVELDSSAFEIHLPKLFDQPWHYDSVNSRVNWQLDDAGVRINSSIIDVKNDYIHGHVQFDLLNSRDANGDIQTDLTLLVGVMEMDASLKSLYLPRLANVQTTMDWLDESLLAGDISNSGFVSRTLISRNVVENSGTVQTFYNVEAGELKFLPDWPVLSEIRAFVNVDNNEVDVFAEQAMIENMPLSTTVAEVRPDPEGGSWLTLQGSADTSTDLGLNFLKNTPVRDSIGDFLDDWQGRGSIHVDINLGIGLNNPNRENDILVNVLSNMSTLSIPAYSLSIDELRGSVVYDSSNGLSANALSGKLFDFPIAATIQPMLSSDSDDQGEIIGTRIVGSGRASKSALQAWQGQPDFVKNILDFTSGEIDYLAEVTIPNAEKIRAGNDSNRIRLSSELLGLAMDLPHPFNKTVENIRPLEVLIEFSESEEWVSAKFDNRVGANIRIEDNEFSGGTIIFGAQAQEMRFGAVPLEATGLVFKGFLDRFNYDDWEVAANRFTEISQAADTEPGTLDSYISLVDVNMGELSVLGQALENVHTRVSRVSDMTLYLENNLEREGRINSWLVSLENDLLSGDFVFPDDVQRPWKIDLEYLRFPEQEEPPELADEQEEVDIFADINPATLPNMNFHTREFSLGEKAFGAWEFVLRTNGVSASISELKMTTPDARIRDLSGESGANLDWRFDNGMHTSSFNGLFSAGDMASVLPSWGYDANLESENAAFVSNLQWTGSPAAFDLKKVIGDVQVEINNGRFVDIDSGGSRLFGAFSFDSLVRRLQLDFSDLYEKGLAYDVISGNLDFNRGTVKTDGEFEISGPSSRITINGDLNLIDETIDADMLVNVPFGQNISVLAGILGAWPIAVSTFIASRLFKDQMDEFTTVLYRLEGPWENPSSGFEPTDEILEVIDVIDEPDLNDESAPVPAANAEAN